MSKSQHNRNASMFEYSTALQLLKNNAGTLGRVSSSSDKNDSDKSDLVTLPWAQEPPKTPKERVREEKEKEKEREREKEKEREREKVREKEEKEREKERKEKDKQERKEKKLKEKEIKNKKQQQQPPQQQIPSPPPDIITTFFSDADRPSTPTLQPNAPFSTNPLFAPTPGRPIPYPNNLLNPNNNNNNNGANSNNQQFEWDTRLESLQSKYSLSPRATPINSSRSRSFSLGNKDDHALKPMPKAKNRDKRKSQLAPSSNTNLLDPVMPFTVNDKGGNASGDLSDFLLDMSSDHSITALTKIEDPVVHSPMPSRSDIHTMFGIPRSEAVIERFSCAKKGKLLKRGKMYVTDNYVCFHSKEFQSVSRDAVYKLLVNQCAKCGAHLSEIEDLTKELAVVLDDTVRDPTPNALQEESSDDLSRFSALRSPNDRKLTLSDLGYVAPKNLRGKLSTSGEDFSRVNSRTELSRSSEAVRTRRNQEIAENKTGLNANTINLLDKWLAERAREDARYRTLNGVVFGKNLENLPLTDKGEQSVTVFIGECLDYLRDVGMYITRLFQQHVDPTEVATLRASIEGGRQNYAKNLTNPKLLAALLVQFLNELPVPIISYAEPFVECASINLTSVRHSWLRSLLYTLPFVHRSNLIALTTFFKSLIELSHINATQSLDLARVFGPVLVKKPSADFLFMAESVQLVDLLINEYDHIFKDTDIGVVYMMKRGYQIVKHATLDIILLKLADPYYTDVDFVDTIMVTHDLYFLKTEDFVAKLISIYDSMLGSMPWKVRIRLRILTTLTQLVKHSETPPHSPVISTSPPLHEPMSQLAWFHARYRGKCSQEESVIFEKLVAPPILALTAPEPIPLKIKKPKTPKAQYQPIDLAPQDVACQIALIDLDYFKKLPLKELMAKNFTKPEKSPNFHAMVQMFNRWSMWVATEIFACTEIIQRVEVIEKIVDIASFLRDLRDFHGSYAITAGLGHFSIVRLHMTFERVSKKTKTALTALQELFKADFNHKNYREALQRSHPPMVPYLGLYPKDLFVIEENLGPNIFPDNNMINLEKMRSVFQVLKTVKYLQSFDYPIVPVKKVADMLVTKDLLNEDEMDVRSKEVEPRKSKPLPNTPTPTTAHNNNNTSTQQENTATHIPNTQQPQQQTTTNTTTTT